MVYCDVDFCFPVYSSGTIDVGTSIIDSSYSDLNKGGNKNKGKDKVLNTSRTGLSRLMVETRVRRRDVT